jgi:hypothetical protein
MIHRSEFVTALLLILSLGTAAYASPTLIDSQPDGKRVLVVTDDEVARNGNDKAVVYIDGNNILTDPRGSPVLVVDDDAIRHSLGGIKLAQFDGEDIRHSDINGKVVINYHHPDICPDSRSNRIYTVDGPELTKAQLVAVLYVLNPHMFDLTAEETAAKQKAFKEAGEEADREAAKDHVVGKWEVLSGSGPVEHIDKGDITFGPKQGPVYPALFDYSAAGGPKWMGVATAKEVKGDQNIFAAYGTEKAIGLCVYEINGGDLTGTWYPWYFDGDAKNQGSEVLKGGATLGGEYKIVSAKAPTTGAAYSGTVTFTPQKIVGASDDDQTYVVTWTLGDVKAYGIGLRSGNQLFVASGAAKDITIAKFRINNGSFSGDFFKLGEKDMGSNAAMSSN